MKSVEVKCETRALKSTWTRELAVDLDSYHNIDIDKELDYVLKEEIRKMRTSNRKKSINKIFNKSLKF